MLFCAAVYFPPFTIRDVMYTVYRCFPYVFIFYSLVARSINTLTHMKICDGLGKVEEESEVTTFKVLCL
jgi:hypothetical protein